MILYFKKILLLFIGFSCANALSAQPNTEVAIEKDKPKQYETRKLGSEKTGEKSLLYFAELPKIPIHIIIIILMQVIN
jgi:hypothetical protein